jgi:hypothetical protein
MVCQTNLDSDNASSSLHNAGLLRARIASRTDRTESCGARHLGQQVAVFDSYAPPSRRAVAFGSQHRFLVVLFSAAIPHQGGTAHLNEQWQAYWAAFFAQHGYVAVDCIRPRIYGNAKVEWWYRQNILIYCRPSKCPKGLSAITTAYELNGVDPAMISHLLTPSSGREALKTIRRVTPYLIRSLLTKLSGIDFGRAR